MSDQEQAEQRAHEAADRENAVFRTSYGTPGSRSGALRKNMAMMQAQEESLGALCDVRTTGGGPSSQIVDEAIAQKESQIAETRQRIHRYSADS